MITAEVHSDDHIYKVTFDAQPWFEQANDKEILALADVEWGGDYESDYVAKFFEDSNDEITSLFDYCVRSDQFGFECNVDEAAALAWIRLNRPELMHILEN